MKAGGTYSWMQVVAYVPISNEQIHLMWQEACKLGYWREQKKFFVHTVLQREASVSTYIKTNLFLR